MHKRIRLQAGIRCPIQSNNVTALIQSQKIAVDYSEAVYSLQMATIASTLRTVLPMYLQARTLQITTWVPQDDSYSESRQRYEGHGNQETHMLKTFFCMRFATSSDNIGSSPRSSTSQAWPADKDDQAKPKSKGTAGQALPGSVEHQRDSCRLLNAYCCSDGSQQSQHHADIAKLESLSDPKQHGRLATRMPSSQYVAQAC